MISTTTMPNRTTPRPIRRAMPGWRSAPASSASFDPKSYNSPRSRPPPGPAAANRQRLGNPQIDANGILWVSDGPNGRWLSYDTKYDKFASFQWPRGHGNAGGNSMAIAPDGKIYATGAGREVRMLDPQTVEFKFYESPSSRQGQAGTGRLRPDGRRRRRGVVGRGQHRQDGAGSTRSPARSRNTRSPMSASTPSRAA